MKATLIDYMGSDLTVVNAARVSFDKESDWAELVHIDADDAMDYEKVLSPPDEKLIRYLAKHNHWTPFAHPQITLRIEAPVFVRTQCFKHKVGFVENEVSRRYVDSDPIFFKPKEWRNRPDKSIKQGSEGRSVYNEEIDKQVSMFYKEVTKLYKSLLTHDIAPEQARMVLPQSMYTQWYWTGSLAAYARFCRLRTEKSSQLEIQELANQIINLIQPLFPVSWEVLCTG